MKKILTAIAIIISLQAVGQNDTINSYTPLLGYGYSILNSTLTIRNYHKDEIVISKFDTTILYDGDKKCKHNYASEQKIDSGFFISCDVLHGLAGCPEHWLKERQICTTCLRHIDIKETRRVEVVKNEYEAALERLNKKLNK